MRRAPAATAAFAAIVALALAAALSAPAARRSAESPHASCTLAQKQARVAALRRYQRSIAAARAAFFRRHPSPTARAAFVRRQQRQLRALRAAAACTVALPPQQGAPCAPELTPVEDDAFEQARGSAILTEGTLDAKDFVPSLAPLRAIVLPVDFSDAPTEEAPRVAGRAVTADLRWFSDVSYGRFSVTATLAERWFRMPRPLSEYVELGSSVVTALFADATAAADAEIDFSAYRYVYIVLSRTPPIPNVAVVMIPGRGVVRDGTDLRHGTIVVARTPEIANHELLHGLGLPDLYVIEAANSVHPRLVGAWDPMSIAQNQELLAWHKWRLRWIDPAQIACIEEPETLTAHLTPVGRRGGLKMVVVPTSPSTAYVVEARAKAGRDRLVYPEGVLVYTVDARMRSGRGPVRVLRTPSGVGDVYEDAFVSVEVRRPFAPGTWHVRVTRK